MDHNAVYRVGSDKGFRTMSMKSKEMDVTCNGVGCEGGSGSFKSLQRTRHMNSEGSH